MSLSCTRCSVGKDCRVKAIEDALDEELRRQVKYFHGVDLLIEGVVEGKVLLAGSVLPQNIVGVFLREILRVLQHDHFFVQNLYKVELSLADLP